MKPQGIATINRDAILDILRECELDDTESPEALRNIASIAARALNGGECGENAVVIVGQRAYEVPKEVRDEIEAWRIVAARVSVAPAGTDISTPLRFQHAQADHIAPLLNQQPANARLLEACGLAEAQLTRLENFPQNCAVYTRDEYHADLMAKLRAAIAAAESQPPSLETELAEALRELRKRLWETFKLDVRKHSYLMIGDAAAGTVLHKYDARNGGAK